MILAEGIKLCCVTVYNVLILIISSETLNMILSSRRRDHTIYYMGSVNAYLS